MGISAESTELCLLPPRVPAGWLLLLKPVVRGKVPASKIPTVQSLPVLVSTLFFPIDTLGTSASPKGYVQLLNVFLTCHAQGWV